jgi:hypothetical protein
MKTYGGLNVYIHVILTLALVGGEWSASSPSRLTPREVPRAGLDAVDKRKFLHCQESNSGRPARSYTD